MTINDNPLLPHTLPTAPRHSATMEIDLTYPDQVCICFERPSLGRLYARLADQHAPGAYMIGFDNGAPHAAKFLEGAATVKTMPVVDISDANFVPTLASMWEVLDKCCMVYLGPVCDVKSILTKLKNDYSAMQGKPAVRSLGLINSGVAPWGSCAAAMRSLPRVAECIRAIHLAAKRPLPEDVVQTWGSLLHTDHEDKKTFTGSQLHVDPNDLKLPGYGRIHAEVLIWPVPAEKYRVGVLTTLLPATPLFIEKTLLASITGGVQCETGCLRNLPDDFAYGRVKLLRKVLRLAAARELPCEEMLKRAREIHPPSVTQLLPSGEVLEKAPSVEKALRVMTLTKLKQKFPSPGTKYKFEKGYTKSMGEDACKRSLIMGAVLGDVHGITTLMSDGHTVAMCKKVIEHCVRFVDTHAADIWVSRGGRKRRALTQSVNKLGRARKQPRSTARSAFV